MTLIGSVRKTILPALVMTSITAPAQASITTLVYGDGRPAGVTQTWVDDALVPVVPGRVLVHPDWCPGLPVYTLPVGGYSCINEPGDEMWVRVGNPKNLRRTLAHELGHRFDWRRMTRDARVRFRRIMGYRGPWYGAGAAVSPFELFADGYGACLRHDVLHTWLDSIYDYDPSPHQHRLVCGLIRSMGHADDLGPRVPRTHRR